MLPYAISSIQKVLQSLPANSDIRVGFVTFDGTLHFYNIRVNNQTIKVFF